MKLFFDVENDAFAAALNATTADPLAALISAAKWNASGRGIRWGIILRELVIDAPNITSMGTVTLEMCCIYHPYGIRHSTRALSFQGAVQA